MFQESWNTRNLRRKISDVKELIDGRDKDRPNETKIPSIEGRQRLRGIVRVRDRRSDFGVRKFIPE